LNHGIRDDPRLEAIEKPKKIAEVTHETRLGSPARDLAAAASEARADLVIVASFGPLS
jgi:hypothetical protein